MAEQIPFGEDVGFAENPEQRVPCVLLVDVSGSMRRSNRIDGANAGLVAYKEALNADSLAAKRVEVAVVTFGSTVETVVDFTTAASFQPPILKAHGDKTVMGAGILEATDMVRRRKSIYKPNAIDYYRPWIFMITDGEPTDEWCDAAARVREGEQRGSFVFFAVGVDEETNFDVLRQIATRAPVRLKESRWREMFLWLSDSQGKISRSKPGEDVQLPHPSGWATV